MHRLAWLMMAAAAMAQPPAEIPERFSFEEGRIRVLILTGRNNHDWRATTPLLRAALEAAGRFDVRVTEEPAGLDEKTLRPYHVLVSNYCGPRWGAAAEAAVEGFVRGGRGLAVVHAASYPFGGLEVLGEKMTRTGVREPAWPAWGEMVGAVWSAGEPRTGHGRRHVFQVEWKDAEHPVAAGMRPFLISDELYNNFRLKPGNVVLAEAFDDPAQGGTGRREPLLWARRYGSGRVFHTALGHDTDAMRTPGFLVSFVRGVEWAATGAVTLGTRLDLNPKDPDAVRVLLVTGGHDHEASFYEVLEGHRDIRVNVDPHPVAFRHDLRKLYDVLVLYDSIQVEHLPESHRENLRAFVESGKGAVLLHHAIVDFAGWEWWWREVAGGLYVLQAREGMPASRYLHDVELVVEPVGGHPITRELPPMRLFDETYKGVWRRPDVVPLLRTTHPTSDEVIGWVSPYAKSRIVFLQPGHGRETHELPWYRRLVRQAVLWAAGR
ncbi:MAG: ThuA domain-containing protein [Bryobacteraceae bacterium]|nr:ThuA domain-containing protein [Bryobacteraceae bacterium]